MPLARCVRRASDGRDRSRRAVSGFGRRLGANFVDALAQTTTGFVTRERREEQGDRGADNRAKHKTERERPEDRSIGVATDYAADLAPPVCGAHFATFLRLSLFLLPYLPLQEARTQDLHRGLLVLELRALVLTRDDDAGWQMGDPDGRLGLVDVLPARSGRAICVDPEVLRPHFDLGLALDLRRRIHQGERGLTPLLEVERRDPHEPMRASLGLQVAVRERSFDGKGRAPASRLVAWGGLT